MAWRLAHTAVMPDFDGPEFNGYKRQPIPNPLDERVGALVGAYEQATPDERQAMLKEMDENTSVGDALNVYAQRMATFAVREGSADPIRSALIAIGLASPGVDYRYNVIATSLLFKSAEILGIAWEQLVEEVADLIPPSPLERFRDFPTWKVKNRRVEAMGYTPEGSGKDFQYRRTPPRIIEDQAT
jgi:hypothetical protein